jgi:NAD(P)-dependent dehydrogenase (short-subunit alcohol dehydrogenase family)
MRLAEKVAIVTGAASGIGQAVAIEFAKHGAKVVATDLNPDGLKKTEEAIRSHSIEVVTVLADLTKMPDISEVVEKALDEHGRIDILFSCHGIAEWAYFLDTTEEMFDREININLKSHFLLGQRVARVMKNQGKGKMVFVSSPNGGESKVPLLAAYSAAKGGLTAMALVLSVELAPYKINVNVLMPGHIRTPINEHMFNDPVYYRNVIAQTPLRRIGETSDITPAAVFMCSDESDYMTGHTLFVDGGTHKARIDPTVAMGG